MHYLTHIYLSGNQNEKDSNVHVDDTIEEQNHKSRFFSNIIATAVIWINVTQSKTDLGTKKIFRLHRLVDFKGV